MSFRLPVLTATAAVLLASAAHAGAPLAPPANQALAHDILKELVAINTVHDHGTLKAAQAIQARLKAAGFTDADVQLLQIPEHPEQAQVVARLRAKAPKAKPVLFIGHLDVVEAKPEDWTVDPFTLTEKDGWWYGRGTQDMKGEDAIMLASLIRLKSEGYVPDRDLIFAFTSDEEVGDEIGAKWLLDNHRSLIDSALVINTDAGGGSLRGDKRLYYGVETSEKIYLTFQLETTNKGGHSSIPEPDNAIYRLAAALGRIAAYQFPIQTTATTRGDFAVAALLSSGQEAEDLKAVAKDPPDLAAAARLSASPRYNAALRTTCVATGVSGGHSENALPQRARATIQCRMMPNDTQANVAARLTEVIADPQVTMSVVYAAKPSPESPPEPKLMAKFTKVVHDSWPGTPVAPHMDRGASDSVFTRGAGLPSYGLSSIWSSADDNRAHGRDERISAKAFAEGLQFHYNLIKAMAQAD